VRVCLCVYVCVLYVQYGNGVTHRQLTLKQKSTAKERKVKQQQKKSTKTKAVESAMDGLRSGDECGAVRR
jgi:hypothetical protein